MTVLLQRWRDGDTSAISQLTPLVYDELLGHLNGMIARRASLLTFADATERAAISVRIAPENKLRTSGGNSVIRYTF